MSANAAEMGFVPDEVTQFSTVKELCLSVHKETKFCLALCRVTMKRDAVMSESAAFVTNDNVMPLHALPSTSVS